MFRSPFRLGKALVGVAQVREMITRAYRGGGAAPATAQMKAQIDALSAAQLAALFDDLESWWHEARAFALTHRGESAFQNPDNVLLGLPQAFLPLACASADRARLFLKWGAKDLFVTGNLNDIGIELMAELLSDAGVVLDDPADMDLMADCEAALARRPMRAWQYDIARRQLARLFGRPPATRAQDLATRHALLTQALTWAQKLEAWRDGLVAASPDGNLPIPAGGRPSKTFRRSIPPRGSGSWRGPRCDGTPHPGRPSRCRFRVTSPNLAIVSSPLTGSRRKRPAGARGRRASHWRRTSRS